MSTEPHATTTSDAADTEFVDELGMAGSAVVLDDDQPGIIRGVRRVGAGARQQTRVIVETDGGELVDEASDRVEVLR